MRRRITENIIIIILALTLIIIIVVLAYINSLNREANKEFIKQKAKITPSVQLITPEITKTPALTFTPTIDVDESPGTKASVQYNPTSEAELLQKIQNKTQLSAEDQAVRTKLLLQASQSVNLYESANINIEYNSTLDMFEIEIKTVDIFSAKQEGAQWFRNQGFSQEAICNYPIEFYLNWEIMNELSGRDYIMDSLPLNC